MPKSPTRLELTWIGKHNRPKLEPRILLERPEHGHGKAKKGKQANMLIHGDNLLALKALEAKYSNSVDFVYIDPPYNTGSAFEFYDDGLEHSVWLQLMRERVLSIHRLLKPGGVFSCHIDDSEGHYLKAMLDEIFGRENYRCTFYIKVRYSDKTLKEDMDFHKEIEYVHIYNKAFKSKPNKPVIDKGYEKFKFQITVAEPSSTVEMLGKKVEIFEPSQYKIEKVEGHINGLKEIWATGSILDGNSSGRFFRDALAGLESEYGLSTLYRVYGIGDDHLPYRYFTGPKREGATKGKYFQGVPKNKREKNIAAMPISTFYDLAANFGNCRHEGSVDFRSGKKPEVLVELLLKYFTKPGDLVLDSFAGSGTTGAVSHKMGRRWIMCELGDHAFTHIVPRMRKVIDGEDPGGVTETTNWKGGGAFRTYQLAPTLMTKDDHGQFVINPDYNAEMLAEAVCRHEGYTYDPSQDVYWIHGRATEQAFIYVTTQTFTAEQLRALDDTVGEDRGLLVVCSAWKGSGTVYKNLTLKKIPRAVLDRCDWGRDDYSLNVESVQGDPEEEDDLNEEGEEPKSAQARMF